MAFGSELNQQLTFVLHSKTNDSESALGVVFTGNSNLNSTLQQ
jgi:hypothetical protein